MIRVAVCGDSTKELQAAISRGKVTKLGISQSSKRARPVKCQIGNMGFVALFAMQSFWDSVRVCLVYTASHSRHVNESLFSSEKEGMKKNKKQALWVSNLKSEHPHAAQCPQRIPPLFNVYLKAETISVFPPHCA